MSKIKALGIPKIKTKGFGNDNLDRIDGDFDDSLPTISFKVEPDIEVGKKNLIQFLISGSSSMWKKNDLTIKLVSGHKDLTFTTLEWVDMDYGFTIKTNVTPKKAGKFSVDFLANNKCINSLTLEAKYKTLENPKLVKDTKVNYTDIQKAQMIATVYGESSRDENLCVNIPWIYYNLTKKYGFEKGLNRSSYYKDRNDNKWIAEAYKVCMYYLGQGDLFADNKMVNGTKIKDYCKETNKSFSDVYKHYIDIIRNYFNQHIFNSKDIMNPFYNWEGQGYWRDMNIRMNNSDKEKWAKASQYFHLQKKGYVKIGFVKEIIAYDPVRHVDSTTYLCDDINIAKYFKDNPTQIPKFEEGKCVSAGNNLLCDKNERNAIPGVHFDK